MTEDSNMGQLLINKDSSFDKPDNSFLDGAAKDRFLKQFIFTENLYNIAIFQEALNVLILTGNRHIFYQIFLSNPRQFPGLASG